MSILAKRQLGFSIVPLYHRREPHAFHYLSQRVTFWIAIVCVFAFVTGNMIGQHGWSVFWKSVLGAQQEVQYAGFVPPLAHVPDYACWAAYGGNVRDHTFRQVPLDCLVPLPEYVAGPQKGKLAARIYLTEPAGAYADDRNPDEGSHPGHDIAAPEGTPVLAIGNGTVERTGNDAGGFGLFVVIRHDSVPDPSDPAKKTTVYSASAHLHSIGVAEGEVVRKGQVIGTTGSTGNASTAHLHFQIDLKNAPWHPYWPFSYTEARQAGLTFSQAVDKGLFRDRVLQHTINPMLYIQAHRNDQPAVAALSPAAGAPASKRMTTDDRLRARMAKWNLSEKPSIAWAPSAASSSSSVAPSLVVKTDTVVSTAPIVELPVQQVASARIRHDGGFSANGGTEELSITLLDESGEMITSPILQRPLELRTAYGRADFSPSTLTVRSFRNGVATVDMRPSGQTTVVVVLQPLGSVSEPMRYER